MIDDNENIHLGLLDDLDHQAMLASESRSFYRDRELQIQALGAAISRRDWGAVEAAYAVLRDVFYGK